MEQSLEDQYALLHENLAQTYQTTSKVINYIRQQYWQNKKGREEMYQDLLDKLAARRRHHLLPRRIWKEVFAFIQTISEYDFREIVKPIIQINK